MYWHTMKTCALLLGLVTLAGAREGRPLPKDETFSSKSNCEDMAEDSLGHQKESVPRVLTDALLQLEKRITESAQLQEERMTAILRDTLRLQDEKTSAALQAVVRQVGQLLQEWDEAALRRALDERLQRMEEGKPSTPSPERAGGGRVSWQQLERRVAGLEAACSGLLPLSTPQAPTATPSASTSSSPSTFPSTSSTSTSERPPAASASSAHHQQTERMRVEERMKEAKARRDRAQSHPSPLGEALRKAAWDGSLLEVERLLDEGADVNYTSAFHGFTALIAAAGSTSASSLDVVSLLLRRGADVNAVDVDGVSALHYAAANKPPLVPLLLGAGAEVDARNGDGATPLHEAALYNEAAGARALLAGGARKDLKAWDWVFRDKTPFDVARGRALRKLIRP